MANEFVKISPVKYWSQHVLPLVYGQELSYMEQLDKFQYLLNELIKNNNELPEFIIANIEEYITTEKFEEALKNIIPKFLLNVKYPPAGITPATGDGSTEDTEAFQGCIDYVANNGGGCIFVPSGKYLTSALKMQSNVSLIGLDRYNTKLVLKAGSDKPLIYADGPVSEICMIGLCLDGNGGSQVNDLNVIELTVNDCFFSNLRVLDGQKLMSFTSGGTACQITDIIYGSCAIKALELLKGNSDTVFTINDIYANSIASTTGDCIIDCQTDNAIFTNCHLLASVPYALKLTGNYCSFSGIIKEATNDYLDTGVNNSIAIIGKTEKLDIDTYDLNASDISQTATANFKQAANDIDIDVTNNYTLDASSIAQTATGDITQKGKDIILNPENPITYRSPEDFSKYFKTIPFKDYAGNTYNVLTSTDKTNKIGEYLHYMNYLYYYVDGTNGSDDNDGLTEATAFKTIDKFFDLVNTTRNDARVSILTAGTYDITKNVMSAVNLHILGNVDGITLNFNITHNAQWYGVHFNIQKVSITVAENYRLYFESSIVTLIGVNVLAPDLRFYGCTVTINECTFNYVTFIACHGYIYDFKTTNTDSALSPLKITEASVIHIGTGVDGTGLREAGTSNALVTASDSILILETVPRNSTLYYYAISIDHCFVITSAARWATWVTRCASGTYARTGIPNLVCNTSDTAFVHSDPETGDVRYDTSTSKVQYYNGSSWVNVS